jgi:hypothetical protein
MKDFCNKASDKDKITKPKDPKLVGGIYFNPPSLALINKEFSGMNSVNVFQNFFNTKVKMEMKEED